MTLGASIVLAGAGTAQADPTQSLVNVGEADATARGTTAGIAVLDRVTGRYADNGAKAHARFGSASLVKLFIADSLLRRARLGQITLSSADRSSLRVMLRSSDDASASRLWSRFGGAAIVDDVVRRYRLTETRAPANPRYWGRTQVTAHDLVRFYQGMLSGSGGLSAADRTYLVDQLRGATAHGTDGVYQWFGLHDELSREPVIGIKQGWMCCFSDGWIWRHSTGLVGKDNRYVVVVLTRDPASLGAAHTTASVSRVVRRMFPSGLVPRVTGSIGDLWYRTGGHTGALGLPITDEIALPGGAFNHFQRGSIYWTPAHGSHIVTGSIRSAWARQGWERGRLGYPTTDEIALPGGAYSRFQGGVMYWSPATGAHWLTGEILETWTASGGTEGPLGYPTGDPQTVPDGTRVDFEHGSLTLLPGGAVVDADGNTLAGVPSPEPASRAGTTSAPAPDAPATDAPTTDAPTTDAPTTDAPRTDVPAPAHAGEGTP